MGNYESADSELTADAPHLLEFCISPFPGSPYPPMILNLDIVLNFPSHLPCPPHLPYLPFPAS